MATDRISAEARGRLRLFKKGAQTHKAAIDRLLPVLRDAAREISHRSSLRGRARVFDRLQARMAPHARLEDARLEGRTVVDETARAAAHLFPAHAGMDRLERR